MKKNSLIFMMIGTAILLSACGQKKQDETLTTTAQETTVAQTTAVQEGLGQEDADFGFTLVTGTVVSLSSDNTACEFKAKDGTLYTLDLNQIEVETLEPLEPEKDITVIGKSSQDTLIPMLIVDGDESLKVETSQGNVVDQAMSTFTIVTTEGEELSFLKTNYEGRDSGVLGQAEGDSNGSGVLVQVEYVSVSYGPGEYVCYPLRVEAGK